MQIPKGYPKFETQKILIVALGTQEGRFINAHEGQLEEIKSFKLEETKYSDREGHFLKRGFGKIFGSGSVYEEKKQQKYEEFASKLEDEYKKILNSLKPDKIILIYPDYIESYVKSGLPAEYKNSILLEIKGNYWKKKSLSILKEIRERMNELSPKKPVSEEARKILEKGRDS